MTDDEKRELNAESLSDAVREAAHVAGGLDKYGLIGSCGFAEGAVWVAGRLPDRAG